MKHVLASCVAFSVAVTPISSAAQFGGGNQGPLYLTNPSSIPYRGGRIGIAYERQLYQRNGIWFYRVTQVDADSNFTGLAPGDFIYAINGYFFASPDDLYYLVGGYVPGTTVTIDYLDASQGMAPYRQSGRLLAPLPPTTVATRTTPNPPAQPSRAQAEQDLDRSLDAIVQSDSRGWLVNRYDSGSMHGSHIEYSSPNGATYTARGYYTYNQGSRGWVDARVSGGRLSCIEYWDSWAGCRQPNGPGGNAYSGAILAGLVLAVIAVAASSASGSSGGDTATASGSNYDDSGASSSRSRSTAETPRQRQEPRIGGENGLYGCVNPPCWDRPNPN